MIGAALRAHIRRLFYVEHWKIRTIAAELGVHRNAVYEAIESAPFVSVRPRIRPAMLDPSEGMVGQTLEEHPHDLRQRARFEVAP